MAIYNQKDVRIKVNGADLFCSSASIKYNVSIKPRFRYDSTNSFEFSSIGAPNGTFDVSYFLTGQDPLAAYMINDKSPISLDFNGLSVASGYLKSYSFDVQPYSSLEIRAGLVFYEKVGGTFATSQLPLSDIDPLAVSDLTLDNGSVVSEDKIRSINYSFQSDVKPSYLIEENFNTAGVNAGGVVSNHKRINVGFSLFDYDLSLPVTGQEETFNFNFKDKNENSVQTYSVNGFVSNKSLGAKVQDRIVSDYSLNQANLGGAVPSIDGLSSSSENAGTQFVVSGSNFSGVDRVMLGQFPLTVVGATGTTGLAVTVPNDVLNNYKAPVRVITQGGEAVSATSFMSLNGLSHF
jgi:hypothetical protein